MTSLLNVLELNTRGFTRPIKTKYEQFECNTMLMMVNINNTTINERTEIKAYADKEDIVNLDMNTETRKINFGQVEIDMERVLRQSVKICDGIEEGYLLDKISESKIVLLLISRRLPKKVLRTPKIIDQICGLVLLEPAAEFLYLAIICSQRGLGGKFLKLTEDVAHLFDLKTVKLDSLDAPFPFYIKNNFFIDNGVGQFTIGKDEEEKELTPAQNLPQNLDKHQIPYTGIIHTWREFSWIYIGNPDKYEKDKWMFLKPGFIVLYNRKYEGGRVYYKLNRIFDNNPKMLEHVLRKTEKSVMGKRHYVSKFRVVDENSKLIRLNQNASVLDKLFDISIIKSNYISMTKQLTPLVRGKKKSKRKGMGRGRKSLRKKSRSNRSRRTKKH